jgi:cytochrome c oxidase accessory protein FixG
MVMAASAALYANFAWFREQLCLVACPYGRLQGVLVDDDTLVVGYDARRGEPRGKKAAAGAGDCVDCKRCVVVCPTAIDIRDGYQLDCIGCTACIDACDEIMTKLERPTGLIRYDSLRGLRGDGKRHFLRPRIWAYAAFFAVGATVATVVIATRRSFEAHVLRPPGIPFTVQGGRVYDPFDVHIINKKDERAAFHVSVDAPGAEVALPEADVTLGPMEERHVPVTVSAPVVRDRGNFVVGLRVTARGESTDLEARFLGPTQRGGRP